MEEYYKILGVPIDAELHQVKNAYRDLAKVWHPDRFENDPRLKEKATEKLKEINKAYKEIRAHVSANTKVISEIQCSESEVRKSPDPTTFRTGQKRAYGRYNRERVFWRNPEPTLEEYGLTEEEYFEYKRRFDFELLRVFMPGSAFLGTLWLYPTTPDGGLIAFLITVGWAIGLAVIVYIPLKILDVKLAERYPQHERVRKYERARKEYFDIYSLIRKI